MSTAEPDFKKKRAEGVHKNERIFINAHLCTQENGSKNFFEKQAEDRSLTTFPSMEI